MSSASDSVSTDHRAANNEKLRQLIRESIGDDIIYLDLLPEERPDGLKPDVVLLLDYYSRMASDKPPILPTSVKIATISSTCNISQSRVFDLGLLRERLMVLQVQEDNYPITICAGGDTEFGNCLTVKMSALEGKKRGKQVNLVIFQNGRITITGGNTPEYGLLCARSLLNEIRQFPETFYNVNPDDIEVEGYRMTMIKCDYEIGFNVDQVTLYNILLEQHPYYTTYNPECYPGITIHYMWKGYDKTNNGFCKCTPSCLIKKNSDNNGDGSAVNDCREITVVIFQTKIIIVGANTLEQVDDVYDDMNKLLLHHYHSIKRMPFVLSS